MSKENRLVVKDNSLIDASFNLSLVEQRLMLLAIVEAREIDKLTPDTPIEVRATAYRDQYKIHEKEAYNALREAGRTLKRREFTYLDRYKGVEAYTTANWVNKITYVPSKGMIILKLSEEVISMISRLQANFTQYLLEQVSDFKSKHSIRLYELLIKYRDIETSKKFEIAELRSKLGLENDEYKVTADFKKRVLDVAIKEISDKADIQIKYEQFKEGRTISHILFKFVKKKEKKPKDSKDKNTIDMFTGLSIKQIMMFADKLSRDTAFQNHYTAHVGELERDYAIRIGEELAKPERVLEWMPYLKAVGYVPNNK